MPESLGNKEKTSLQILQEYSNQGYLFHGSHNGEITQLEPRPATDTDVTNTFNNDRAIFATDLFCSSLIFAIISRSYIPDDLQKCEWSTNWSEEEGVTKVSAHLHESWKPYIEVNNFGYVYVLPAESFTERRNRQRKSKVVVTPIDKVNVTLEDFIAAGGQIELIK